MLYTTVAHRDALELVITGDHRLYHLLVFAPVKFRNSVIVDLYRSLYDRCFISHGPSRFEDALHTSLWTKNNVTYSQIVQACAKANSIFGAEHISPGSLASFA